MVAGPPTLTPPSSWPYISGNGYNYAAIVRAIKVCLLAVNGGAPLTQQYDANFEGIVRGLSDLAEMLQGHLSRSIVYDPADPNAFIPQKDGSLMFDTRQGRLLVRAEGEWWQTNGAESLAHIGDAPPRNGPGDWIERQGQLWLDTRDNRLYVYVQDPLAGGEPGWYELPLANAGAQAGPAQPAVQLNIPPAAPAPAGFTAITPLMADTPPPGATRGQIWVDTSGAAMGRHPDLKVFDGTGWVAVVQADGRTIIEHDAIGPGGVPITTLEVNLIDGGQL